MLYGGCKFKTRIINNETSDINNFAVESGEFIASLKNIDTHKCLGFRQLNAMQHKLVKQTFKTMQMIKHCA